MHASTTQLFHAFASHDLEAGTNFKWIGLGYPYYGWVPSGTQLSKASAHVRPSPRLGLGFYTQVRLKRGLGITRPVQKSGGLGSGSGLACQSCMVVPEEDGKVEVGKRNGVVTVDPKPSRGFISNVLDLIERAIIYTMYNSSKSTYPTSLAGNFAPIVEETPPCKDLPVRGTLPECLNGEFFRVGPNPKFAPVAGYHWFDGDGMIHGMRIKDGKATYVSRYVKTSRLKQEEYFGGAKFMKVGDLKGLFGLLMVNMQLLRAKLKVLDVSYGTSTGNTALIYHHGKLLALSEADKPYVVKVLEDGDLQTLGILDYDKCLAHSFTAHPKVDPFTGEMFTFGYSYSPPYVTYRVIAQDGKMFDPVPITISESVMMHDFAITENYAIFMDLPLYIRPKEMVKDNKFIFTFDSAKKARFGVLPRYAKDELQMRWFELPNCCIFHNGYGVRGSSADG